MAQRKPSKRAAPARTSKRAVAKGGPATDVTMQSAEQVIGQVKLLCDDDTNVVFFRQKGRLFMMLAPRG
jgi:hypothetical protein